MNAKNASGTPAISSLATDPAPELPEVLPADPLGWLAARPLVAALLVASLAFLLAHAWAYRFLTDDAFISFRYARNLANGHGLVFNPGMERVEGYSNFLWVLILAGLHRLGLPIEPASLVLSFTATILLWILVVRETLSHLQEARPAWLVLIPAWALALTRSVAVWSSSGLETRLFELLIVVAAFRLAHEVAALENGAMVAPWSGVWLGLAEWTRPDGLLVACGAFGAAALYLIAVRRFHPGRFALLLAPWALLVGVHLAFRLLYYGYPFPNTYYAKVDGRLWWQAGFNYVAAFVLEYGVYLWIPLVAIGAAALVRERRGFLPLLIAGLLLPHVLYVAAIGGDHFEYRPLDLIFPFAFLLIYHGARRLARTRAAARALVVYLALIGVGLWEIPLQSHLQFPREYIGGFPGGDQGEDEARRFLAPDRDPIYRLPGLRAVADLHRRLVVWNTFHFSAVRQEEHRQFLESMRPAALSLRGLVEDGRLPRDVYIAMPCVGVIPYVSDIRTLDRIGLTDAHVAHSPFTQKRRLAHDKNADEAYARERGVDLWAEVRPVCGVTSLDFLAPLRESLAEADPYLAADLGHGVFLIGRAPQGAERLERRMPRLKFEPMSDPVFFERYVNEGIRAYRERLRAMPSDDAARMQLALLMGSRGEYGRALELYEETVARRPEDGQLWLRVGWCYANLGNTNEAEAAILHGLTLARARGEIEIVSGGESLLATVRTPGTDPSILRNAASFIRDE